MNKNLGIFLVLLGLVIVVIIGGFLIMQVIPKNNVVAGTNSKTSTNSQPKIPLINQPSTSASETYNVEIKNFAFSPSSLTIKKGDAVIWTNQDSVSHTIKSDSGSEISSQSLSNGGTYSHVFENAGTYNYHCTIHPSMKAKIIVE